MRQNVTTNDAYASDASKNVVVSYMNCGAELMHVSLNNTINGMGTFIHEFSHGMGLTDHYATNTGGRVDNQTPEYWDLMDYGEHAGNGYFPVPYTAWEQETMGWLEVEELVSSQTVSDMLPLLKGGKAYKFGNGADAEEWIYLENVQSRDATNQIPGFVYGHGLLAMHVAYPKSFVIMSDYPNNTAGHPGISIVPADGLVINGYLFGKGQPYTQTQYVNSLRADPFPGTGNVDHLNATMELPNYRFYNGEAIPKQSLSNITENNGVISFYFNDGTPSGINDVRGKMDESSVDLFDLQGRRVAQPTKGLYIVNGKKVAIQ
jgi:immune inhibitor A